MTTKQTDPDLNRWREMEERNLGSSRKRRYLVAAAVLVVAAVSGWLLIDRTPDDAAPSVAQSPPPTAPLAEGLYVVSTADGSAQPFGLDAGLTQEYHWFRYAPDGSQVTFTQSGAGTSDQIWIMNADGSKIRQLTTERHGADGAEWSPDGRSIVYQATGSGDLAVLDLASGTIHRIAVHGEDAVLPSWRPDGSAVAFQQGSSVRSVDLTTGSIRPLLAARAGNPEWSPDGSQIAFDANGRIMIADADGSGRRVVEGSEAHWQTWSPDGSQLAINRYTAGGVESVWLYDLASGQQRRVMNHAEQVGWKDDGTLIVQAWG